MYSGVRNIRRIKAFSAACVNGILPESNPMAGRREVKTFDLLKMNARWSGRIGVSMKRIQKRIIGSALAVVLLLAVSMGVYAVEIGCNKSYALRQLSNVPDSSWVKQVVYEFQNNSETVTVTCTQNTTNGASVYVALSGGGSASLNQAGVSYSKPVKRGDMTTVLIQLVTPDNSGTYTGYGTVVN